MDPNQHQQTQIPVATYQETATIQQPYEQPSQQYAQPQQQQQYPPQQYAQPQQFAQPQTVITQTVQVANQFGDQ
jgi:hypothetical protein